MLCLLEVRVDGSEDVRQLSLQEPVPKEKVREKLRANPCIDPLGVGLSDIGFDQLGQQL